tara:strand:+ start:803 stop:1357 length:555 start_codon:yes stop_codon:yes gene_type:complete
MQNHGNLHEQKPFTIWLTGLSAAGKTTLAQRLKNSLKKFGYLVCVLDGDNIRCGLGKDLGFSNEDRSENVRRVAEVSKLMNDSGLIVIASLISPFTKDREKAKEIVGFDRFFQVYVSAPISVCEKRDPKGMYRKARKGLISGFTGVDGPYEPPQNADFCIDTSIFDEEECARKTIESLRCLGIL